MVDDIQGNFIRAKILLFINKNKRIDKFANKKFNFYFFVEILFIFVQKNKHEIMSILIKDTTKEQRIDIVRRSLEDSEEGCDNFYSNDVEDMYIDYIEGRKELREINAEFRTNFVVSEREMARSGCGMGYRS